MGRVLAAESAGFCFGVRRAIDELERLLESGGVVYTLGMIPFARNRKYDHCVWHVFVLAAAALHWAGIYTQIY